MLGRTKASMRLKPLRLKLQTSRFTGTQLNSHFTHGGQEKWETVQKESSATKMKPLLGSGFQGKAHPSGV